MTRSRYKIFDTELAHFLSCTIVGWLPVFTRPDTVQKKAAILKKSRTTR
jgi:REP-associated tyrosine transposase